MSWRAARFLRIGLGGFEFGGFWGGDHWITALFLQLASAPGAAGPLRDLQVGAVGDGRERRRDGRSLRFASNSYIVATGLGGLGPTGNR